MIGYVLRCDQMGRVEAGQFATHQGWTVDVLEALRFAREEDAKNYWRVHGIYSCAIVPVVMSPQWPAELREVRDAMVLAEQLRENAETLRRRGWFRHRGVSEATRAMEHARSLCYELFKRAILREPVTPAKVALPAKAQG